MRWWRRMLGAGLLLGASVQALQAAERPIGPRREPIPDEAARRDAETLVRDFFGAHYVDRTPARRAALAQALMKEAAATNTDLDLKYALLQEARAAAVEGGDPATALRAIECLGQCFAYDASTESLGLLRDLARSAREADAPGLAALLMERIDECVAADRFSETEELARLTETVLRKLGDADLAVGIRARLKAVAARGRAYEQVVGDIRKLERDPTDPQANAAVGRYCCEVKGDWVRGLPLLARGADPVLRKLASDELAGPATAAAQAQIADRWWALAEQAEESARFVLQEHAVEWYLKAYAQLDEAAQAAVKARVAAFGEQAAKRGRKPPVLPSAETPLRTGGVTVLKRTGGRLQLQKMTPWGAGVWAEEDQLWWTHVQPGDRLDLGFAVAKPGVYTLNAFLTKAPDYGIVQFHLDGRKLGEPFDAYAPGVIRTPALPLGRVDLTAGDHVLTVEILGANPKAVKSHLFGFDELKPVPAAP